MIRMTCDGGSVIERLARYHLPLRHRPCNNSRSPEYKVNIYLTAYLHYITTRPSFSLSFPFPFPFLFFFLPSAVRSGRPKEINDITASRARARARPRGSFSFLLCHFRSLHRSLSQFVCALL